MSVTYTTATKTRRMTAVRDEIDVGGSAGKIELGTSAMGSTLATITLSGTSTSGATISGTVLTFVGFPKTVAASAGGTLAAARVRSSTSVDVVTGLTVATSAADVIVDNTSVANGQNVTAAASPTLTHG